LNLGRHSLRVRGKSQVATTRQANAAAIRQTLAQGYQAGRGDQQVAVARQNQRGYADSVEPFTDIEPFRQPETVGHDSLVGSPALLGDKLE
jgi:hypothetical protein